jgi:hypothetical protein
VDFDFAFQGGFVFELEPATAAGFVTFIISIPGKFEDLAGFAFDDFAGEAARYKAKLEVAVVSLVDRDVGLDFHIEVVFVPGFHFGNVPGAGKFAHLNFLVGLRFLILVFKGIGDDNNLGWTIDRHPYLNSALMDVVNQNLHIGVDWHRYAR